MDPNSPTELPTDLTDLTPDQLDAAETAAREEGETLGGIDGADLTEAQVTRIEQLADFLDSVATERTSRETAATERAQRAEAARQRMAGGDGEPGDGEGDEPAGDEPPAEDAPAEGDEPADTQVESLAAALVSAVQTLAGGTPAPGTVASRMRQPRNNQPNAGTQPGRASIIAGADIGDGVQAGSALDLTELGRAFVARSAAFPEGEQSTPGIRHKFNVGHIDRGHRNRTDGLYVGNPDYAGFQQLAERASSERRLPGGSLVAAGGWCAPSEVQYPIPSGETLSGILDLPTVGVDRGGFQYTAGPDYSVIYTDAGFAQTEAQATAGTTKNCVEVDCPDFDEVRLDAVGTCVKAPLLTRAAYPELIERWINGTVIANAHKVNARLIASMRTLLGTAIAPTLTGTPITWSTLTALELACEGQRQAYRLDDSETLEVVAPRWLRVAIRADLANRNGIAAESVSNAQIAQHFADRNVAIQWVLGYLELANPTTSLAFPATVELMVYRAGTFVKGEKSVVSIDTLYDTANLQTNVYTASFVEDGVLVAKMQNGGVRITLPVNVSGMLGSPQLDDSWGNPEVENAGAAAS